MEATAAVRAAREAEIAEAKVAIVSRAAVGDGRHAGQKGEGAAQGPASNSREQQLQRRSQRQLQAGREKAGKRWRLGQRGLAAWMA